MEQKSSYLATAGTRHREGGTAKDNKFTFSATSKVPKVIISICVSGSNKNGALCDKISSNHKNYGVHHFSLKYVTSR